ncbi:hypothetical protein FA95DRAFT_1208141 [Auriscalpium vulgare]|uniref:Uncharacterized protein n=1 Tax=Auriscalpium vulgare TaxID=40419 RepID=A0ACB8RU78_9AGAM|nr:hypothetical protein FA95DRAFT_1208141 [Auriscalpium vulgare]
MLVDRYGLPASLGPHTFSDDPIVMARHACDPSRLSAFLVRSSTPLSRHDFTLMCAAVAIVLVRHYVAQAPSCPPHPRNVLDIPDYRQLSSPDWQNLLELIFHATLRVRFACEQGTCAWHHGSSELT